MNTTSLPSGTLVTGDTGFVGQHALACWPGAVGMSTLAPKIDIRDKAGLLACLRAFQPSAVLHLAALSFVPNSFRSPEETFEVNFLGTLRLLEALAETGFKGRFVFVGTGDAYGLVSADALPILEDRPLRPRNPYAVSKAAAEALCYQWSQTGPFEVMMARPFNHIGAGQAPTFAISDFARQIAGIAAGRRPPQLSVGNIEATRDFTDVADVVRAYALLLAHGQNGEIYNVCSGVERSVRTLLERLLSLSGVNAEVVNDPARLRPSEQPRVCGSHQKLSDHTGWQPMVPMDESLLGIYHYWEREIDE
jgi:GDP-4-dehydro-6-deoxy-D-mannose reductase